MLQEALLDGICALLTTGLHMNSRGFLGTAQAPGQEQRCWCMVSHTATSNNGSKEHVEPAGCCSVPWEGFRSSCMAGTGKSHFVFFMHFSIPAWRRNHCCRSSEEAFQNCLLAAQCLGAKFKLLTVITSSDRVRHVNLTLLLLHKLGPANSLAGAGRTEPSLSTSQVLSTCTSLSLPLVLAPSATLSPSTAQTPMVQKSAAALASPAGFNWDECHVRLC